MQQQGYKPPGPAELGVADTEESRNRGGKPMMQASKDAKEMARRYFADGGGLMRVDAKLDANEKEDDTMAATRETAPTLWHKVYVGVLTRVAPTPAPTGRSSWRSTRAGGD